MEQWLLIVGAAISVFAVIGVGAGTRWLGWLSEEADQSLLKLILRVLVPCLIFSVVSDNPALKQTGNLIVAPAVGIITMMIGFGAALLVSRLPSRWNGLRNLRERRSFAMSTGIYNYGYIPIPLIKLLFGDETLGVLFVHNIGAEMAIWTIGVSLISSREGGRGWRHAINPPSVTILVALVVNFLGIAHWVPDPLDTAIDWLGQAAIPMSIILIGATMADQFAVGGNKPRGTANTAKLISWACLLRLGLLPMAFLAVGLMVPAGVELKRVIVVEAAMPAAVFSILLARLYGGDPGTALRVTLGTSLVSLLTIPLWIPAGLKLLGIMGLG